MNKKLLSLISSILALTSAAASADYLTLEAGDWNIFRKNDHSIWYGAQYRSNYIWDKFLVNVGVGGNNDGGLYGYVGAQYDWNLIGNWYMIPGFGIGAYSQGGSKDLGGALEFKSSIELDYQLSNNWRVGAALWHISNAGIYNRNPGTEVVEGTVSIPLGSLF